MSNMDDQQVLAVLRDYLAGGIALDDLRDCLAAVTFEPNAPSLAHAIEHIIDEAALGRMSSTEMTAALQKLSEAFEPAYA